MRKYAANEFTKEFLLTEMAARYGLFVQCLLVIDCLRHSRADIGDVPRLNAWQGVQEQAAAAVARPHAPHQDLLRRALQGISLAY